MNFRIGKIILSFLFIMNGLVACTSITTEGVVKAMKSDPVTFMKALNETEREAKSLALSQHADEIRALELQKLKENKKPYLSADRYLYGSDKAAIKIVKYADFQCPACRVGYMSLEAVKKKYGNRVAIIHKHVPLEHIHPLAKEAAWIYESLLIKDVKKARAFYQDLYRHQDSWDSKRSLWKRAKNLGARPDWVNQNAKLIQKRIHLDVEEHKQFGFRGTPAFIVEGVTIYGAHPPQSFYKIIDEKLKTK